MKKISIKDMKQNNKKMLIDFIVKYPNISRLELSELSGFSPGTITALVSELIQEEKIVESKKRASTGGRPKIGLTVNTIIGDIVIFEVKQRSIITKIYTNTNELYYEHKTRTNYLNGNTILETIKQALETLPYKPRHIGVLIEENIKDAEISYLLSTSISQDSIPLETALKMYLDIDVTVERSLKYLIDEEVMNITLDNIELYAYVNVDEYLSATVFNQGEEVFFNPNIELRINLTDTFELNGNRDEWDQLVQRPSSPLKIGTTEKKTGITGKQANYETFINLFAEAVKVMLIFYPLDAIFLIGKSSIFPTLDKDLLKKVNKTPLQNKLKLVQMVVPSSIDASKNMNKLINRNQLIGG